jgi:hypothetical protein
MGIERLGQQIHPLVKEGAHGKIKKYSDKEKKWLNLIMGGKREADEKTDRPTGRRPQCSFNLNLKNLRLIANENLVGAVPSNSAA